MTGWNDQAADEIEQIVVLGREPFVPLATRVGLPATDASTRYELDRRWVFRIPLGHAVNGDLRTVPAGSRISAKVRVDPLLPTGDVSPPRHGERAAEPLDPFGVDDGDRLHISWPKFG